MDLSIVLCTWNNARRLAVTLEAISRCRIPPTLQWELVLVANNCTDATADVARGFDGRLPLVHVAEPRQGLSHARNTGVAAARGRLILFADDDITPCVGWITAYWLAHRERPAGYFFGGPLTSEYEIGPPEPDLFALAGISVTGVDWGSVPRILEPHERFMGANWACPADALRAAGPFDPSLGLDASLGKRRVGEEWDMMQRLRERGLLPWCLPHAVVAHFVPADKSLLEYTAANWEASGLYSARRSATSTPFLQRRRISAGIARTRRHVSTASRGERIRAPLAFSCAGRLRISSAAKPIRTMLPGDSAAEPSTDSVPAGSAPARASRIRRARRGLTTSCS